MSAANARFVDMVLISLYCCSIVLLFKPLLQSGFGLFCNLGIIVILFGDQQNRKIDCIDNKADL
ncbi:hypothetical protein CLU79DRAFT_725168 [Phycomyces nitens]|nr:hypothetical protein CLU79DRAFT_725168 [Phycomyces nitens]